MVMWAQFVQDICAEYGEVNSLRLSVEVVINDHLYLK
jgi:hypothetical protein